MTFEVQRLETSLELAQDLGLWQVLLASSRPLASSSRDNSFQVTMCFGNMAYAFGLSPPMAAVLGKVYTPVLAVGERLVLKKRRRR